MKPTNSCINKHNRSKNHRSSLTEMLLHKFNELDLRKISSGKKILKAITKHFVSVKYSVEREKSEGRSLLLPFLHLKTSTFNH